jgi:hypothetical protein
MTVETLLSRLEAVKQTGPGRWIARCPAHSDKSPSLAIRELDDGRVLLHCFGGCSVESILDAIGLTFDALFPPRSLEHRCKPERRPFPAADVLRCLSQEALITASCGISMLNGVFASDDRERLITAVSRVQSALAAAGMNHA